MACISNSSDELLLSRVDDALYLSERRQTACFIGFLNEREQAVITGYLQGKIENDGFGFWGGYPEAERCMLAILPDFSPCDRSEYPFVAVAFHYRKHKMLTHRDVLGSLMSIGLKRDAVGDILCGEGCSVAFIRRELSSFVSDQIDQIGAEGITITVDYRGELPICIEYESFHETIPSNRLDVMVRTLARISREDAAELIRCGLVAVNHLPVDSVSKTVEIGSVISIRGYGRFYIDQIGPETKKGRLLLLARRRK